MKIIISPAKKMHVNRDDFLPEGMSAFLPKTEKMVKWIQRLSRDELRELWKCNDKLLELNFRRFHDMNLYQCLTPAVLAYEGIQYQYMAPQVMETKSLDYLKGHLKIVSALYGVLSSFDGVVPYRLEMQAKLNEKCFPDGCNDLYEYWKDDIYREITSDDHVILNLASKEYSKVIEPYLTSSDTFVTCVFGEFNGSKIVQKGTLAKMARGEMVNYLAEVNATTPEAAKGFQRLGFEFQEELSTDTEYVFLLRKQ